MWRSRGFGAQLPCSRAYSVRRILSAHSGVWRWAVVRPAHNIAGVDKPCYEHASCHLRPGETTLVTRRFDLALWAVLLSLTLASCASQPEEFGEFTVPDSTSPITNSELKISPLDVLTMSVFGVPELRGDYQVDQQGRLKVPLVNAVQASGLTTFELSALLANAYSAQLLQSPDVTITVKEAYGQTITVEGSVNRAGLFPVRGQMTLLQAVALAGGTNDTANPKRVVVFRTIDGERKAAGFNLVDIRAGKAQDPVVFGNDIVVVDGANVRGTYRELLRSIPLLSLFVGF